MAWKLVKSYSVGYKTSTNDFLFYYSFAGETKTYQLVPNLGPQEFLALVDMFRNEGPISYNTDGGYFVSAAEQPGEGE